MMKILENFQFQNLKLKSILYTINHYPIFGDIYCQVITIHNTKSLLYKLSKYK